MAQPANDWCEGAVNVPFAADEGSATLVGGDTRGATPDTNVSNVCSGSWFADDIWFSVTLGDVVPENGLIVRSYFGDEADDVLAVGMAIYPSCDTGAAPIQCFSSADPADDRLVLSPVCLEANATYLVRVWSGGSPTDNSGTVRVGAYGAAPSSDNILWEETFGDGLAGWETFGTCGDPDSNANATWKYLPNGLLDGGNFIFAGAAINSFTLCDGAVGVDSDFDDNGGTGDFGAGPCPAPGQYFLVSPAIDISEWGVAGVSITWTQAIRQFQSTYFVSFRTWDGVWGDWNDFAINDEFETNADFVNNDVQRLFIAGATNGDSLQIRYVYNANYYMWGIDDIRIVETEAHNMRSQSNFYAIAPALNVPLGQERAFYGLNDIYNAGSVAQTNVNLNLTVYDAGMNVFYNEDLSYGTIGPDSLAENVNFPTAVDYSGFAEPQTFAGMYTVTSDSCQEDTDFNFDDNVNRFEFHTNRTESNEQDMFTYALEDSITGSFNVAAGLYDDGAPRSWTWGNYFYFPNGSQLEVDYVEWGISNPEDIPGQSINVILFKWSDLDGNQIVQANERQIVGFASVPIAGDEGAGFRWETVLENFNAPGEAIQLEDGAEYLVMIEYNASDETGVFLNASEFYDYGAVALSSEQAWQNGMGTPAYMGVLGHSPDGNVQGIDYEIKEFGDDGRTYFGNDIVPAVRLFLKEVITGTNDLLDASNKVDLFPNPANREVTVQLDLADTYEQMEIQVIDVSGKIIENRALDTAPNQTIELNVSGYANGAYILKLQTEKGIKTTRFVVQH